MAKAVNKTVVGILTLVIVILLSAGGFVVVANMPGQDPKRYEADAKRFEEEKKWAEARQMYARAFQRDPAKNPAYMVAAARCALEEGDIGLVQRFIQFARQKDSRNKGAAEMATRMNLEVANVVGSTQRWAEVRKEAENLVSLDQQSALGLHALGAAYLRLQSENSEWAAKGEEKLLAALSLDPTNVEIVKLLTANDLEKIRNLEVARKKADADIVRKEIDARIDSKIKACQAEGDQAKLAELYTLRASNHVRMGDVEKGIKELEEFVEKWPKEALGYRTLGWVYLFPSADSKIKPPESKFKKAEELLRKAVELAPGEGETYLILGQAVSLQNGRADDENAVYAAGLEAVPFSKHFREFKQNLYRAQMMYLSCINDIRKGAVAKDASGKEAAFASAEKWIARLSEEQDAKEVKVLLMKANLASAKGDLKQATKIAIEADTLAQVYEVKALLGELNFLQQEWGAARRDLEAAIAMGPQSIVPYIQLGQTYLMLDQPALTLKLLKPTEAGPLRDTLNSHPKVIALLMEAYRAQGLYEQAAAESRRLESLTGDTTGAKLREIRLALAAEKFREAEDALASFIAADKVDVEAARLHVYLLEMTERRDAAIKFVNEMMKKSPDESAYLEMAAILNRSGSEPVSDETVLEIINKEKDPFLREMKAFQFWASRAKFDKAQVHLDNAEKEKPDDEVIIERQFLMALNAKDWDRAATYAEKNKALNIDGTKGRIAQGRIATARGLALKDEATKLKEDRKLDEAEAKSKEAKVQFTQAIEQIKAGLAVYPNFSVGWTNLAEAYLGADRLEDSRSALQRALDLDPTNGLANRAMVQMKLNDGDEEAANEFLAKAVKALPNDPYLRQRLEAAEEKKKPVEGIRKREAILAREPDNLVNLVRLAQLYRVAEKYDRAATMYESALKLAKNDPKVSYLDLLREVAYFYTDPLVNRPAEGEGLLQDALRETEAKADKAQLAIYLSRFYESQQHISTAERHMLMAVNFDTSASVLTAAAEFFSRINKLSDAIEYYERAMKSGVADEKLIRSRIFSLCMALRDYDRAKIEIDAYNKLYPDDKDGRVLLATYHMMCGDLAEAEKALTEELEQRADNPVALWQRGQIYALRNRWPQAYSDLSKAKAYRPDGFEYQHRIALADTLVEMGRYEEAITELKTILDKNPKALAVASALADVYFRVRPSRFVDAERLVKTYMAQYPKDERWALLLGRLGALSNRPDQEIDGYTEAARISEYRLNVVQALFDALRRDGRSAAIVDVAREQLASRRLDQSPTVLAALGWAFSEMGDRKKAFEAYDRALAAIGGDFSYHALILMEMCDYYGVDEIFKRASEQAAEEPDNIVRQKTLLFLLWRNKQSDEAIKVGRRIVEQAQDDRDRIFARMALAAFLADNKRHEEAKAEYEEILRIDPNDLIALNNLACLLVDDLNKPQEALPYAERAAKGAPRDPNVLDTLGWTLAKCNQLGRATTFLLRALEANSDNAPALYHMAHVDRLQGDDDKARERLEKAHKIETQRVEGMKKMIDNLVAQLAARKIQNGRVLRQADSDILPKIEAELNELK